MDERPDSDWEDDLGDEWEDPDWKDDWDEGQAGDPDEPGAEPKYTVTPAGQEALAVVGAVQAWLEKGPKPNVIVADGEEAQIPMRAFLEGWGTGIQHALAPGPLTLAELDLALSRLSGDALQERLAKMRDAGLLEAGPDGGEEETYAVTDWLRQGIGPFVIAVRTERRRVPNEFGPPAPDDVEAAFLLALPPLELPPELSGHCRLLVDLPESDGRRAAGAMIRVEGGRVASCSADIEGNADSWAMGSLEAWLNAVIEADPAELQLGGDAGLARAVLEALHARYIADFI